MTPGLEQQVKQLWQWNWELMGFYTAVAQAKNPAQMAYAMNLGVKAGRLTYLAGRMEKKYYANASSPLNDISTLL